MLVQTRFSNSNYMYKCSTTLVEQYKLIIFFNTIWFYLYNHILPTLNLLKSSELQSQGTRLWYVCAQMLLQIESKLLQWMKRYYKTKRDIQYKCVNINLWDQCHSRKEICGMSPGSCDRASDLEGMEPESWVSHSRGWENGWWMAGMCECDRQYTDWTLGFSHRGNAACGFILNLSCYNTLCK